MKERKTCRISNDPLLELFTLGDIHISDFIATDSNIKPEKVELKMCISKKSGLAQLAHTAPSNKMYEKYWYKSGTNKTMVQELFEIAESTQQLIKMELDDIWVDIGCNDGTLLSFVNKNFIRVGFDPAKNNYKESAEKHASLFVNDYFTNNGYTNSRYGNKKAKVITSIAMFYDLEDPNSFVSDIYKTLDNNGLWIIQMSYLPLMLKQLAFDNICHEHLEYYSLSSLKYLLDKHNFSIVDCHLNNVNGGSFRIYIRKKSADPITFSTAPHRYTAEYRTRSILVYEKTLNLTDRLIYDDFYKKIKELKKQTVSFVKTEKAKGRKIWGYGASTKGNTLLQWFGLDNTLIDAIAERSPAKYGLKTIGSNIPIYSEKEMREAKPDYLLILPWHFINEFKEREADFLKGGGKFIVPCPKFEIIE